jgi:hypothetical protein
MVTCSDTEGCVTQPGPVHTMSRESRREEANGSHGAGGWVFSYEEQVWRVVANETGVRSSVHLFRMYRSDRHDAATRDTMTSLQSK